MTEEKKEDKEEEIPSVSLPNEEKEIPDIKPGMVVRIHERIKEGDKERIQVFEGMVLAHRGGREPGATITVRKIATGKVGVEKIYPLYSPHIEKIEVVKQYKTRRSKLYYLRNYRKKLKEVK